MREYFRSPYVIIGVIGVVYYLYRRNILVNKMNKEMLPALSSFSDDIPMEFKNDVEKMSFGEMRKCIYENEKLIADKKLQPNEEKKVAQMVKYVVDYNNKNVKKR